jgi:hypothetical protein
MRNLRLLAGAGMAVGLLAGASAALAAQGPPPPPVPMGDLSRRDVLVPENVPNISGSWLAQGGNRTIRPLDGSPTPFLPWAQQYFETRAAAEAKGQPLYDPNASCLPSGVPRVIAVPYPLDIIQTPERIMIAIEVTHVYRVIHMDGAKPPPNYESFLGWSVGHWEGDTLVVETTNLNGFTQVDEEGRPKSKSMKVTERYQKRAPDILEITFLIDDPKTYTHPWTARAQFKWDPTLRLAEYICEENNRNRPDESGTVTAHVKK